jgi:hypothetical protein
MKDIIVYDVEVEYGPDDVDGGWDNPEAMGFATAVAYDYSCDMYHFFEGKTGRLALLKLLDRKLVVTFNGIKFDSRVVLGNGRDLGEGNEIHGYLRQDISPNGAKFLNEFRWNEYDILLEYIKSRFKIPTVAEAEAKLGDKTIHDGSFSLDGLAAGTLGMAKSGHGAFAPVLYRRREFAELFEYNLHDVRLTKKIFDHIIKHKEVIDRNGRHVTIKFAA